MSNYDSLTTAQLLKTTFHSSVIMKELFCYYLYNFIFLFVLYFQRFEKQERILDIISLLIGDEYTQSFKNDENIYLNPKFKISCENSYLAKELLYTGDVGGHISSILLNGEDDNNLKYLFKYVEYENKKKIICPFCNNYCCFLDLLLFDEKFNVYF
jgi:hypothetical protein